MPKAKKAKRKAKKAKSKGKAKKTDERGRSSVKLLTTVINRLGASIATYQNKKHQLIVAHFNHPPFVVDLKTLSVIELEPTAATNVAADAA
jgi:hypothetical protein